MLWLWPLKALNQPEPWATKTISSSPLVRCLGHFIGGDSSNIIPSSVIVESHLKTSQGRKGQHTAPRKWTWLEKVSKLVVVDCRDTGVSFTFASLVEERGLGRKWSSVPNLPSRRKSGRQQAFLLVKITRYLQKLRRSSPRLLPMPLTPGIRAIQLPSTVSLL